MVLRSACMQTILQKIKKQKCPGSPAYLLYIHEFQGDALITGHYFIAAAADATRGLCAAVLRLRRRGRSGTRSEVQAQKRLRSKLQLHLLLHVQLVQSKVDEIRRSKWWKEAYDQKHFSFSSVMISATCPWREYCVAAPVASCIREWHRLAAAVLSWSCLQACRCSSPHSAWRCHHGVHRPTRVRVPWNSN